MCHTICKHRLNLGLILLLELVQRLGTKGGEHLSLLHKPPVSYFHTIAFTVTVTASKVGTTYQSPFCAVYAASCDDERRCRPLMEGLPNPLLLSLAFPCGVAPQQDLVLYSCGTSMSYFLPVDFSFSQA